MLTAEILRALLDYDPETGEFTWRVTQGRMLAGTPAGTLTKRGYVQIAVKGRRYYAHRLAWLWVKGSWPIGQIDHRDEIKSNNRFANLRPATHAQNMRNRGSLASSTSGVKGAAFHPASGKWNARIMVDRKTISLGYFNTPEEAGRAYDAAVKKHHGEFAYSN